MQNLFCVSLIFILVYDEVDPGVLEVSTEKGKDFYDQNHCPNGDTLSHILRVAVNLTYLQKIHLVINYLGMHSQK